VLTQTQSAQEKPRRACLSMWPVGPPPFVGAGEHLVINRQPILFDPVVSEHFSIPQTSLGGRKSMKPITVRRGKAASASCPLLRGGPSPLPRNLGAAPLHRRSLFVGKEEVNFFFLLRQMGYKLPLCLDKERTE
jgi:hypothetical protein